MFKMTRKSEYALLALQDLTSSPDDAITKVREIAVRHNIPFPVLAKVMQRLAQHEYIEAAQGAKGGYRLRPQAMGKNMWQFIEAMEGPQGLVDCILEVECHQADNCGIRSPMRILDHKVRDLYNAVQLKDILTNNIS